MRAVIQRVTGAKCEVEGNITGAIERGLLVFVGVGENDTDKDLKICADKIANIRIFEDENCKMSKSVSDVGGKILLISNFTLYGSVRHGRRPDFTSAAKASPAKEYYERLIKELEKTVPVQTGIFGADMKVTAENDGPVTVFFDTASL